MDFFFLMEGGWNFKLTCEWTFTQERGNGYGPVLPIKGTRHLKTSFVQRETPEIKFIKKKNVSWKIVYQMSLFVYVKFVHSWNR